MTAQLNDIDKHGDIDTHRGKHDAETSAGMYDPSAIKYHQIIQDTPRHDHDLIQGIQAI